MKKNAQGNKKIISVDAETGPDCICSQKDPCTHHVTVTYDTGKKETLGMMSAITIYARFQNYLSEEGVNHFKYVAEPDYWQYKTYCNELERSKFPFFSANTSKEEKVQTNSQSAICTLM